MGSIEPSPDQLARLVAGADEDGALVMINLLRYRQRAEYPPGSDAEPCSGREAYQRYGSKVTPMLAEVGGKILWMGNVKQTVIAPEGEKWDDAILVHYPSRRAFLTMVSRTEYQAISVHRTAALSDSRLIATVASAGGF